jgi:hypothetical protein
MGVFSGLTRTLNGEVVYLIENVGAPVTAGQPGRVAAVGTAQLEIRFTEWVEKIKRRYRALTVHLPASYRSCP